MRLSFDFLVDLNDEIFGNLFKKYIISIIFAEVKTRYQVKKQETKEV